MCLSVILQRCMGWSGMQGFQKIRIPRFHTFSTFIKNSETSPSPHRTRWGMESKALRGRLFAPEMWHDVTCDPWHHATPCHTMPPSRIRWPRLQPERAQTPQFASQSHLLPARCLPWRAHRCELISSPKPNTGIWVTAFIWLSEEQYWGVPWLPKICYLSCKTR